MSKRARIWTIIFILLCIYLLITNSERLPEYGSDLTNMWPFISIAIGFLILFRRKGRPKHDFFFNNTRIQKQLEEISNKEPKQPAK